MAAPSSSERFRQYYIGCGIKDDKLTTVLELMQALHSEGQKQPCAICCSSRDSLDALTCALMQQRNFAISVMVSDMTEREREFQLSNFVRQAGLRGAAERPSRDSGSGEVARGSSAAGGEAGSSQPPESAGSRGPGSDTTCVLAITDVCLKALPKEMLPLGLPLIIEYDLPYKKEVYQRRIAACFGKERRSGQMRSAVVDVVVAGEVAAFRALERFAAAPIQELPVNVADIFAAG